MGEEAKFTSWMAATGALLGTVDERLCQPHSLCVVPEELRKWKENAYVPNTVSIGPRYKGRREILQMEGIKWQCMLCLLKRTENPIKMLETCMQSMLKLDAAVRASYGEDIILDRYDLATIMVLDGCFLLELLIGSSEWNDKLKCPDSSPGTEVWRMEVVLRDLTLLENQIPLFILYTLFQVCFPKLYPNEGALQTYARIIDDLALSLFGYSSNLSSPSTRGYIKATHFLELAHSVILKENNNQQSQQHSSIAHSLNRCATRLQAAGVTIKREKDSAVPIFTSSEFVVKFNQNNGMLEISPLKITQTSESKWRNFIAWEHHIKKWTKSSSTGSSGDVFTFSALLFNDLICCASDVQLLKNRGIIVDELGMSNHDMMDLIRSIVNGVDRGVVDSSAYSYVIDALNSYSATICVLRFPVMVWHYFGRISEWIYGFLRRGYNFAAALITLLTIIQTFYAVLSYHRPN